MRSKATRRRSRTSARGAALVLAVLAASALAAIPGCSEGLPFGLDWVPAEIDALPRDLTEDERRVVQGMNALGFELFRARVAAEPDANHTVSPLGAWVALAMAAEGARGATRSELRDRLGLGELSLARAGLAYRDLSALLEGLDSRVSIAHHAALWHRDGYAVDGESAARLGTLFGGVVEPIDFLDPAAATRMNDRMRARTHPSLGSVVPDPLHGPDDAEVLLASGLRFDAPWRAAFDPARGSEGEFRLRDGSTVDVSFVEALKRFHYLDRGTNGFFVAIPFGGGAWVLDIMLPRGPFQTNVGQLGAASWAAGTTDMHETIGLMRLVRFRTEGNRDLRGALEASDATAPFTPCEGDLTGLLDAPGAACPPVLSAVWQTSAFAVGPEGAPAPPINDTGIYGVQIATNRPFVFAVRERLTGVIVLLGLVMDPR